MGPDGSATCVYIHGERNPSGGIRETSGGIWVAPGKHLGWGASGWFSEASGSIRRHLGGILEVSGKAFNSNLTFGDDAQKNIICHQADVRVKLHQNGTKYGLNPGN